MAKARPRGWWYPWLFVAGMLIVVAVNAVLLTLAIGTFPGLTTEDAYRKGLAYNRTLAAADAQAARGWVLELTMPAATGVGVRGGDGSDGGDGSEAAATIESDAAGGRTVDLVARLVDAAGQPLNGLVVRVDLERPLGGVGIAGIALTGTGDGVYRTTLALADAGQWVVRLHARRGDDTFQESRRFVIR